MLNLRLFIVLSFVLSTGSFAQDISLDQMPATFRKNMGQWDSQILFEAVNNGTTLRFMNDGVAFSNSRVQSHKIQKNTPSPEDKVELMTWKVNFEGANYNSKIVSSLPFESHANYFVGNNPGKYKVNVPDYGMISYNNIYENIDLRYYVKDGEIKYDYILNAGSNEHDIKMSCEGIDQLKLDSKGQLEIITPWGSVFEKAPYAYQIVNGRKKEITVSYCLKNKTTYGFQIDDDYDNSIPLIIDPVILKWCTYVGGSGTSSGKIIDIAVDAAGNTYGLCNYTTGFPVTPGVYSTTHAGSTYDIVVFKLDATGSNLLYATYYGGSGSDNAGSITVNAAGEITAVGHTDSNNLPSTAGCYDPTFNGSNELFLFRLNATGTALLYSTYIGGTDWDGNAFMTSDANDVAYIVASVLSTDFPTTTGAYQTALAGGAGGIDAIIFKINPAGNGAADLLYSTFLGGAAGTENGMGIAINTAGEVFISGTTSSSNFPTTPNGYDLIHNPGNDVFVSRINPQGNGSADLIYSTYLGGTSGEDQAYSIAVDNNNNIYVSGTTVSANFPTTANAFDNTYNSPMATPIDVFVARLDPSIAGAGGLVYSTYLGGNNNDFQPYNCIRVGRNNSVWVAGYTNSTNFPVTACASETLYNNGNLGGLNDLFISRLSTNNNTLYYSTFMGGAHLDGAPCIELYGDTCDVSLIAGLTTRGADMPTTAGAYHTSKTNNVNIDQPVVFKYTPKVYPGFTTSIDPQCGLTVSFTDTTNSCGLWEPIFKWQWDFGDGNSSSQSNPTHSYPRGGNYNVKLIVGCPTDSITIPLNIVNTVTATVSPNITICSGTTTQLSASGGVTYSWSPAAGLNTTTGTPVTAGPTSHSIYTVSVSQGACEDTASVNVTISQSPVVTIGGTPSFCSGSSTQLSASGASTYSWYPSNGISSTTGSVVTVNPTSSLTYTIIGSLGSSCVDTTTFAVTMNNLPTLTAQPDDSICPNSSITFTVTGASTYVWSPSGSLNSSTGSSVIASPTGNTTYTIIGTDGNNCTNSATVSVALKQLPTIAISPNTVVCAGDSALLTASGGAAYSWSPATGLNSTTGSNVVVHPTGNSVYTVSVFGGGCFDTASVAVSITQNPVVNVSGPIAYCRGGSVQLSAGGANNYTWYPSSGAPSTTGNSITVNSTSSVTYTVVGVLGSNCLDTTTVTLTVHELPIVTALSNDSICPNGSTTLHASGATSYLWSPTGSLNSATASTVVASPLISTTYTAIGTDANNCTNSATVVVTVLQSPVTTANPDTTIASGQSVTIAATGGGSYSWWPAQGLSCVTCQQPVASPTLTTTYYVLITDENGCTAIDSVLIVVEIRCDAKFFVPNAFSPNEDGQNDVLYVKGGNCLKTLRFTIYNRWGEQVFETTDITKGWDGKFNGKEMDAAVFTYVLTGVTQQDNDVLSNGNITLIK